MSHTVTVTRTTTTSTTSALILNIGYCKTVPGLLKIAEIIVGAVILALLCLFISGDRDLTYTYNAYTKQHHIIFFLYIVVTFFIGSLLLLLGCLVSISTGSIIAKTSYEFIYHGGAFILYAIATIWLFIKLNKDERPYDTYKLYYDAGVLGIVNSILYCISSFLAYKTYRWP